MNTDQGEPRLVMRDDDEIHKHRCEVRELLSKANNGDQAAVDRYLATIQEKRGDKAAVRLREDARTQWLAGNRGKDGDWRELGLTP